MRINLKLTYVFRRACESDGTKRLWVGWCPELDCMSQGYGLREAMWMLRECVKLTVEGMIKRNMHPLRVKPVETDDDWPAYQDFLASANGENYRWNDWSSEYNPNNVPDDIDICFTTTELFVDTFGGHCLVNESDVSSYGQRINYKTGRRLRVKMLLSGAYDVEMSRLDGEPTLERMRALYGPEVVEVLGWEEIT